MKVSIIILTKNQQAIIPQTLGGVFMQKDLDDFEVIAIDSGSKDNTVGVLQQYPVRLIQIPPREFGHGKTRNFGAQMAKGQFLIFLNGDATPKNPFWFKNLLNGFEDSGEVAGVYSRALPREDCNPVEARDILQDGYLFGQRVKRIDSFEGYRRMSREALRKFAAFHTISCAIKKDVLLAEPFADIPYGEDAAWAKRMLEKGFSIVYESRSEVYHSHSRGSRLELGRVFKRYFDDTRFNQKVLNRWSGWDVLKFPLRVFVKLLEDESYILKLRKRPAYKAFWLFSAVLLRSAELGGMLFGICPFWPSRLAKRFSWVETIKGK